MAAIRSVLPTEEIGFAYESASSSDFWETDSDQE
jgi:hypothetical protein